MKTIARNVVVRLVPVAAVAAATGALVGAGTFESSQHGASNPQTASHSLSSHCGHRPAPCPQFVKVGGKASANGHQCRPGQLSV